MISFPVTVTHQVQMFAPGASETTTNPAEFSRKKITFGTSPSQYTEEGHYGLDEYDAPPLLRGIAPGYYRDIAKRVREKHLDQVMDRLPKWMAKSAAGGAVVCGLVLCCKGFTAPLGAKLIWSGVAAGATFGLTTGMAQRERSTQPYRDLHVALLAMEDLRDRYETGSHRSWMRNPYYVKNYREAMVEAWDMAIGELEEIDRGIVSHRSVR